MNHFFKIFMIVMMASSLLSCARSDRKTEQSGKTVIHPKWADNKNIYEVNIRQYTPEGTFAAFEKHLPRLREMGVDILWLMPVNPIGELNRKGKLGSYYAVRDYLAINPEFGTMEEFKALVKKIHAMDMYVLIDWVANHTSWDNDLITNHPDWYKHDDKGKIIAPVPDWTDVAGLDYTQKGLRDYMTDALKFWVKETDIDGFRCDVAGMVPTSFWDSARGELDKIKPVFMLAEWESPELHFHAFDMTYGWKFHHFLNQVAQGKKPASALDGYFAEIDTLYGKDDYIMNFTSNHDENSWNGTEYERMKDAAQVMALLTYTTPGMPLIYSGQEEPLRKRLAFFDKDTIKWKNLSLAPFYKWLNHMKHENIALWNGSKGGSFIRVKTNADSSMYCFIRERKNNKIFVITNLSGRQQEATLLGNYHAGDYINLFDNSEVSFSADEPIVVQPWSYLVLKRN